MILKLSAIILAILLFVYIVFLLIQHIKQSKKPIVLGPDIYGQYVYWCPSYKHNVPKLEENCIYCGLKLDWSETE